MVLVPHPKPYARGYLLNFHGELDLADYRAWEKDAGHFVMGSSRDPAVIAFHEAARLATEALDTLTNTID